MGHGGGIITWKSKSALLFALVMVISILPSVEGIQTQNTLNGTLKHEMFGAPKSKILSDTKILISGNTKPLEVNAAYKHTKKVKKYKYKKSSYKKVKAAYKYKKYRYKKVKAAYSYKKVASTYSVGAKNVVVTSKYVYATGKNSCSIKGDYNYHTRVFENYNPSTGHWGVLKFEEGTYYGRNKGTSPEGLWVATDTDMDFCLVHGKSHDSRGVYLVPYSGEINGKKVVNGYFA